MLPEWMLLEQIGLADGCELSPKLVGKILHSPGVRAAFDVDGCGHSLCRRELIFGMACFLGGDGGIRTPDRVIMIHLLCRLSYIAPLEDLK